ncbi:SDR family NAD(P)-dependent oxidoreductase [Stenotrophomonas sp. 24(2023)]|uniref:SDR family NAD(P)-dependent oxidoreductase n=1 Tax=Stenotrophomonas sp. 24(2023) TaxID=3068324 RepID=UPI0027E098CA|nr:SDR family NAD(P)-dependent oxidoreductase [Stenotrophomonas sp. 24(2023)]WMJ69351.1 SDR family NAD(P)-dependent oxidoreductase [Stenotrophomonas sp. 24(2023)]
MSTPQIPLGSGFGPATTSEEVMQGIGLHGQRALVTGGYSGLGAATVRALAAAGAHVLVPSRDPARAARVLEGVGNITILPMDLADPASIATFTDRLLASGLPLHLLVNSAGIMATPPMRDARGYEAQFATNHLGHFQLTTALLPALQRAQGARVVMVSSRGHRFSPVHLHDPHFLQRPYDRWQAYGQSKTANILFAVALDRRQAGEGIRAFAVHPGSIVGTGLEKHLDPADLVAAGVMQADGTPILDPARGLKTVSQGAATQLWCATSPQLQDHGGVYCEDVDVAGAMLPRHEGAPMAEALEARGVMAYAVDPVTADALWGLSEQLLAPSSSASAAREANA